MVTHKWKYIGKTNNSKIFVDYRHDITKIETIKYVYYHDGIYPYHNPDFKKRYKK